MGASSFDQNGAETRRALSISGHHDIFHWVKSIVNTCTKKYCNFIGKGIAPIERVSNNRVRKNKRDGAASM